MEINNIHLNFMHAMFRGYRETYVGGAIKDIGPNLILKTNLAKSFMPITFYTICELCTEQVSDITALNAK